MPLRTDQFFTVYQQAAVWIQDYEPSVRELLSLTVNAWASRFDGAPSVLPTELANMGLPAEVPRLTARSEDRRWRIQVGRQRIDVIWEAITRTDRLSSPEFISATWDAIDPFLRLNAALRANRMAYVIRRFAKNEDPSATLATFFCRDEIRQGPLRRPESFVLHAHKAYQPTGLPQVNSWVKWQNATYTPSGDQPEIGIFLEQDLNTLPDDVGDVIFDRNAVRAFLATAPGEADNVLGVYLSAQATQ